MLLLKSHPSVQIGNFKCQAFKAKSWMIVNRVSMSSTDHFHKVLRAMSAKITFMRKKKEMLQQTGWKYMFWKRWDKFYHFALTESPAALGGLKTFSIFWQNQKGLWLFMWHFVPFRSSTTAPLSQQHTSSLFKGFDFICHIEKLIVIFVWNVKSMMLWHEKLTRLYSFQFIVSQSLLGTYPVAHVIVGDSSGSMLDTTVGSLGAWFALSCWGTNTGSKIKIIHALHKMSG